MKEAARLRQSLARFEALRTRELTDGILSAFPCGHRVRVIQDRYEAVCFLDVETDEAGHLVVVTTRLADEERTFVRGRNLDAFLEVWERTEILATFNGRRFDVPVLLREFGFTRTPGQLDFMDEARHYGYTGGLKNIERRIGFVRREDGLTGRDAPELWRRYREMSDEDALDRLVRYNQDDVRGLLALFRVLLPLSLENLVFDNWDPIV